MKNIRIQIILLFFILSSSFSTFFDKERLLEWKEVTKGPNVCNFITYLIFQTSEDSGQLLPLIPDFGEKQTMFGVRRIGTDFYSDWGLNICGTNYCKVTRIAQSYVYREKKLTVYSGDTKLLPSQAVNKEKTKAIQNLRVNQPKPLPNPSLDVKFILGKEKDFIYNKGIGVLGLSPSSTFLSYLRELSEGKRFTLKFLVKIKDLDSPASFLPDTSISQLSNSQLSFYKDSPKTPSSFEMINLNDKWGFKDLKISLNEFNEQSKEVKILSQKENICFAPNLPLSFYSNSSGLINKITKMNWEKMCSENKPCTDKDDIFNGYKLVFSDQKKNIVAKLCPFESFYYSSADKELKPGFAYNQEIFQEGGVCHGYQFAFGRHFFSRNQLNIHFPPEPNSKPSYCLVDRGIYRRKPWFSSKVWITGIIVLSVLFILMCLMCSTKDRDECTYEYKLPSEEPDSTIDQNPYRDRIG